MSASLIGKSSVTDISVAMSKGINRYMELVLEDIVLNFPCIDELHLFQIHLVIVVNLVIRNTSIISIRDNGVPGISIAFNNLIMSFKFHLVQECLYDLVRILG